MSGVVLTKHERQIVDWLRDEAQQALQEWQKEEQKPDGGERFWIRYWSGYHSAMKGAADGINRGEPWVKKP